MKTSGNFEKTQISTLHASLPTGSVNSSEQSFFMQHLPHKTSFIHDRPKYLRKIPKIAEVCEPTKCKLPDCWCGGTRIPGDLAAHEIPQIIMITFDDAVSGRNYGYYTDLFGGNRTNPNGCPIRGTFFVSHNWTDYPLVHQLYSEGHEIASHSINHKFPPINATRKFWMDEISGQRDLISKYANIPIHDIKGMRAPFLQGGGNKQFQMMKEKGSYF